ncbi:hypothetical protein D477_019538 [Arthrobacter crystallopoietes BAB-32]|uniref:Uncharacterized protein n=1 Tax=Arthrobacter crystallopoietes BAB-32 TaxID=1246476 RepID=N1UU15_9MICC|nr:hypothetical protein [Arthrobacter crystallopoietes]EMY32560.1 hypothetical protein D477_019538 [Arthrobacter crystallopoietes BAB-32]
MAQLHGTAAEPEAADAPDEEIDGSGKGLVLTRRQLGLLFGGGAAVIIGGASFGVVAKTAERSRTTAAVSFGSVRLLRAARLGRLAADGRPSPLVGKLALARLEGTGKTLAAAPVLGAGVELASTASGHDHSGGALPGSEWPMPLNLTWGDVVLLDVEVSNTSDRPALFSPGQLRLKDLASGASITMQGAARRPGAIAARSAEKLWVSYLAPAGAAAFSVEYNDPLQKEPQALRVPRLRTVLERS